MRVALNLALARSTRERYALAWAAPATVLGLVGVLLLGVSSLRQLWEYRAVHKSLADLQEREGRLRLREAALRKRLDNPQARSLLRGAQFVNGLIEQKQASLSGLTAEVSKLLPQDARLAGMALVPQAGELRVRFTIVGRNAEAIEAFLSNLEDAPDFKDVALANEGFQEEGPAPGPVTVMCSARYVVGASEGAKD